MYEFILFSLSFVEAGLRESMRLETLVANNVPHKALRDTKVGGYDLPKVFHKFVGNTFIETVNSIGRSCGDSPSIGPY